MRGLARSPRTRYATAREMAEAVEACLGVASAGEVADWVERLAGSVLSARAEIVRQVEAITALAVDRRGFDGAESAPAVHAPLGVCA